MLLTILPPAGMAAPSRDPAVDQYVESVPGAGGDRAPNSEPRSGGERLPSDVRREIERSGGEDAEDLRAVASSPALGAPTAGRKSDGDRGSGADSGAASKGPPSTIDAVTSAAASGDGDAGGWLVAGLALLTAVLAAAAVARRRSLTR